MFAKFSFGLVASLVLVFGFAGCGGGSQGSVTNPTTVTVTFTGSAPAVVATQMGAGSYTLATLNNSVLTLTLPTGTTHFAVAYVCVAQSTNITPTSFENFLIASTLDGSAYTETCPGALTLPTRQVGTLTGDVDASAISGATGVMIHSYNSQYGFGLDDLQIPLTGPFGVSAPDGSDDVVIAVIEYTPPPPPVSPLPTWTNAVKDTGLQTVPGALNGGNVVTFTSADATTPMQSRFLIELE